MTDQPSNAAPIQARFDERVDLYCPDCGYNLRGLASDRCPECGLLLDFVEAAQPLIPWVRRRELGRFRSYWRTVFLVGSAKRFCREMYRPVEYADAQQFRWVTVTIAFVTIVLAMLLAELFGVEGYSTEMLAAVAGFSVWMLPLHALGLFLALAAFSGLPSYFFHPRYMPVARQNRAIALSHYGCAPLAFSPLALALLLPGLMLAGEIKTWMSSTILILSAEMFVLLMVLRCWLCWTLIARRVLERASRLMLIWTVLPLLWLVVGGLCLVGVPGVVYYVVLIFYSLG